MATKKQRSDLPFLAGYAPDPRRRDSVADQRRSHPARTKDEALRHALNIAAGAFKHVEVDLDFDVLEDLLERGLQQATSRTKVAEALEQTALVPGPGAAAQAALREQRWRAIANEWGMWTAAEVVEAMGRTTSRPSAYVSNLRRRNLLLGVKRGGLMRYPAFQFTADSLGPSRVASAWTQLARMLLGSERWSEADALAWASAPNAWLEGRSPAQVVQASPDALDPALAAAVDAAQHRTVA